MNEPYILFLAVFGAIALLTAWIPMLLRDLPLSLPIVCIAVGMLVAWSPLSDAVGINPLENRYVTQRMTEFVLIVALMGAGLKLDRPFSWRRWAVTWRLLAIAMPLSIAAVAVLGWSVLGLGLPAAILLGAALAPTDPVLASDVQVGPPRSGHEDEVRFSLTSEAGLNDGLAFPFVSLAIAIAMSQATGEPWLRDWLLVGVVWQLAGGVACGWLAGKAIGFLTFRLSKAGLARTGDGFVALGVTCLAYGLTALVGANGFVGVFVAALVLRAAWRDHVYHQSLHAFAEQTERLLMMALLVFFGAAIAEGSIFGALAWDAVAVAALIIFAVRPLFGWVSLAGTRRPAEEKAAIAFFGIRGLGSFYYIAYAIGVAEFEDTGILWVTVSLVVLASIVLHGITVTPVMRHIDRRRARSAGSARLPAD